MRARVRVCVYACIPTCSCVSYRIPYNVGALPRWSSHGQTFVPFYFLNDSKNFTIT